MITEILPSAAAVLGSTAFADTLGLDARLGPVRRVAVLLVDGMGAHLVARSPRLAAVLGSGSADELECTLPSTTPCSLVSLGTGVPPGRHGVLGFRVNVPGTDEIVTHILWREHPDPAAWAPHPTVFERAGIPSAVVMPAAFAGGGLTHAAYRGARFVGTQRTDDPVDALLHTLGGDDRLVLGYFAALDTAAHLHGIASEQWSQAADAAAAMIERIVAGLPADAALLVTADHGCLDVDADSRVDIRDDPRLAAGLRVVAGEPRMRYLHPLPGARDDVLAAWTEVLAGQAEVATREDAVASGMFGPVDGRFLDRIGDVVVACTAGHAVFASGWEPDDITELVGMHGGREPVETAIPLVSFVAGGAR